LFHHHQYGEVDQTIVNRGNQSVGHAVDDQAEMLDTTRRIDDDEVVLVRTPNFPELRYELPQVGAMAKRATTDEGVFVRSADVLEPRYEPPQGCDMHLFPNRIMIGQLQFLLVLLNPLTSIPEVSGEG
jgi:hypothetical protein